MTQNFLAINPSSTPLFSDIYLLTKIPKATLVANHPTWFTAADGGTRTTSTTTYVIDYTVYPNPHPSGRATYGNLIQAGEAGNSSSTVNVIANLDIHFDSFFNSITNYGSGGVGTGSGIFETAPGSSGKYFYCLTRWNYTWSPFGNPPVPDPTSIYPLWTFNPTPINKYSTDRCGIWSDNQYPSVPIPYGHDAWCWVGTCLVDKLSVPFPLGYPGCDNAFAYQAQKAGYSLANPANPVVTTDPDTSINYYGTGEGQMDGIFAYHLHLSQYDNGVDSPTEKNPPANNVYGYCPERIISPYADAVPQSYNEIVGGKAGKVSIQPSWTTTTVNGGSYTGIYVPQTNLLPYPPTSQLSNGSQPILKDSNNNYLYYDFSPKTGDPTWLIDHQIINGTFNVLNDINDPNSQLFQHWNQLNFIDGQQVPYSLSEVSANWDKTMPTTTISLPPFTRHSVQFIRQAANYVTLFYQEVSVQPNTSYTVIYLTYGYAGNSTSGLTVGLYDLGGNSIENTGPHYHETPLNTWTQITQTLTTNGAIGTPTALLAFANDGIPFQIFDNTRVLLANVTFGKTSSIPRYELVSIGKSAGDITGDYHDYQTSDIPAKCTFN